MFATLGLLAPTFRCLPRWSHFRTEQHRPDGQISTKTIFPIDARKTLMYITASGAAVSTIRSTVLGTRLIGNLERKVSFEQPPPCSMDAATGLSYCCIHLLPLKAFPCYSTALTRPLWRTPPSRRYIPGCRRTPPKPHRAPRSKATLTIMAPIRSSASSTAILNPATSAYFHKRPSIHLTRTDNIVNLGGVM